MKANREKICMKKKNKKDREKQYIGFIFQISYMQLPHLHSYSRSFLVHFIQMTQKNVFKKKNIIQPKQIFHDKEQKKLRYPLIIIPVHIGKNFFLFHRFDLFSWILKLLIRNNRNHHYYHQERIGTKPKKTNIQIMIILIFIHSCERGDSSSSFLKEEQNQRKDFRENMINDNEWERERKIWIILKITTIFNIRIYASMKMIINQYLPLDLFHNNIVI